MAEFVDVMKQFNRMYKACKQGVSVPVEASYANAVKRPDFFEEVVMSWAAEHPEPVYPTWLEWLKSMGVIPYMMSMVVTRDDEGNFTHGHVDIKENALKPMPADIAQKLGIEPKEGT